MSPRNSSRPNQKRQNNRPNNTPADPRDVRVSRLPFENFLMNGHNNLPTLCLEPIFQSNRLRVQSLRTLPAPSYPTD
jgi:hypothetical protein